MSIRRLLRICCLAALILLVFVGLGPAKWQPRSGLGWELDHFLGYFVLTLIFCFAWPRPVVVGGALVVFATLLEGLQALPSDRSSNALAAFYSACGVLAAALVAGLFIQGRRRFQSKRVGRPSS
jgi:VanZ family protein